MGSANSSDDIGNDVPCASSPAVFSTRPRGAVGTFLRIVHVSDITSLDNYPRLRSAITQISTSSDDCVVLPVVSGNCLSPCSLTALDRGMAMMKGLNLAGIGYLMLGNHEFDLNPIELQKRLDEFKGTIVNSNIRSPKLVNLDGEALSKYAIVGVGQRRVALTGFLLDDASQIGSAGQLVVEEPNRAVDKVWQEIKAAEGDVDLFLPMVHFCMDGDRTFAEHLCQHQELATKTPILLGGHERKVCMESVDKTMIFKTGCDAANIGVVDLYWSADGAIRRHVHLFDALEFPLDIVVQKFKEQTDRMLKDMFDIPIASLPNNEAPEAALKSIIVSGAGMTDFNGVYRPSGTLNHKEAYKKDNGDDETIHFGSAWWQMSRNYSGYWYSVKSMDDTPPPFGWIVDDGVAPAPILTIEEGNSIQTVPGWSSTSVRNEPSAFVTWLLHLAKGAMYNVDLVLLNGGNVRGNTTYAAGPFTYGDLVTEVPFETAMGIVDVPGNIIEQTIRASRAKPSAERGFYLHADPGTSISTSSSPSYASIQSINSRAFDTHRMYKVAINQYILSGMGELEPLRSYVNKCNLCPALDQCLPLKHYVMETCMKAAWRVVLGISEAPQESCECYHFASQAAEKGLNGRKAPGLQELAESVFDEVDTNRDGLLDMDELLSFLNERHSGVTKTLLLAMVKQLDVDDNGKLNRDELNAILH